MHLDGKKILICEEALIDTKGHYQTWIRAIRNMHLNAGATVFVAGNRAVIPEVRIELDVLPTYTVNSWDQDSSVKWPPWRRYLRVFAQNWRVFWETRKALQQTGPVDILFFTSARVHQIIALRALCAWGLGRRFMRMTCFLLHSQAEYDEDFTQCHFPRRARLMAKALRSYAALARRGAVLLAGDSHITCGEYEKLAGVPMTLFPSPGAELCYEREGPVPAVATFSLLGVSTWDKGVDVFQEAVLLFLERHPLADVRFVLQWGIPCKSPDGVLTPISDRLRSDPRVSLFERRLSSSEYADLFRDTDFIVLPYRKTTYFNRISGVAVEAAVSGKVLIVTDNTWLAWAMREFGHGLTVPEGSAKALCAAFEMCCAGRDVMTTEARARMAVAREYNCSERYLGILWSGLGFDKVE